MPLEFVQLACTTCGASLEIYQDMEIFVCGHCGTKLLVQRRGGTVGLKALQEGIARVQIGTDKTAAELALSRYSAELEALKKQRGKLEAAKNKQKTQTGCGIGCAVLMGLFCLLIVSGMESSGAKTFGVLFVIVSLGSIPFIATKTKAKPGDTLHDDSLQNLTTQIIELEQLVAKQRNIANS